MDVPALDLIRTLLFVPGNRPDRFDKARTAGGDGMIVDLEDAVALAHKAAARQAALAYLAAAPRVPGSLLGLRINGLGTLAGLKDVSALAESPVRPDVLVVPKTEAPAEIVLLDRLLAARPVPYAALIETAAGLRRADDIAAASPRVRALIFGGVDLSADLRADLDWEPMLVARCSVVRAAAAAGIAAWDVPYLGLRDADDATLAEEARRVKALGFTGKLAVHPRHVAPILGIFTPAPGEVARARRVVDAYEGAEGDVCEVDGKMIDVPVYRAAKRTLALAGR